MAKKKLKLKKKFRLLLGRLFLLLLLIIIIIFGIKIYKSIVIVSDIEYKDGFVIVDLSIDEEVYCMMSNSEPSIDAENWVMSLDGKCNLKYEFGNNYLYIKNDKKIIYSLDDKLEYALVNPIEKEYIPLQGNFKLFDVVIGNAGIIEYNIENNEDNIVKIDSNGVVTGNKRGEVNIKFYYNNESYSTSIIVNELITKYGKDYDYNKKEKLTCNYYSKEENDLVDEILKHRIETVGYKTRAGVVEAARFLTLEFPYRIDYFYENGRQTTNNVDGEGRYYHEGLYLHSSRYSNITGKATGPKTWGCSLYSNPIHKEAPNGMDCSGFVSWALLNAGFDVKDVGAGFRNGKLNDLTDFGELVKLNKNNSTSGDIKVGDLLHSLAGGGHIAIIVGMDEVNYYIAQALWYEEANGVIITTRKKEELHEEFNEVILMDKYYIEDGKLTNLWY